MTRSGFVAAGGRGHGPGHRYVGQFGGPRVGKPQASVCIPHPKDEPIQPAAKIARAREGNKKCWVVPVPRTLRCVACNACSLSRGARVAPIGIWRRARRAGYAEFPSIRVPIRGPRQVRAARAIRGRINPGHEERNNDMFYMDKTMIVLGEDENKVFDAIVKAIEWHPDAFLRAIASTPYYRVFD